MLIDKNTIINSTIMDRIKGYLMALDDLSGYQREFSTVATLIKSNQSLLNDIKDFSTSRTLQNPHIVYIDESKKCSVSESLFEELIMPSFLSGLYPPLNRYNPPNEIVCEYKQYVLSQLLDLIEFTFSEIGISIRDFERDIEIALVKDGERYFITLAIKKKPYKMLFFFYMNSYTKEDYETLFNKIKSILKKEF